MKRFVKEFAIYHSILHQFILISDLQYIIVPSGHHGLANHRNIYSPDCVAVSSGPGVGSVGPSVLASCHHSRGGRNIASVGQLRPITPFRPPIGPAHHAAAIQISGHGLGRNCDSGLFCHISGETLRGWTLRPLHPGWYI